MILVLRLTALLVARSSNFLPTHRSPNLRQDIHFVRATPRVEGGQTSRCRTFFAWISARSTLLRGPCHFLLKTLSRRVWTRPKKAQEVWKIWSRLCYRLFRTWTRRQVNRMCTIVGWLFQPQKFVYIMSLASLCSLHLRIRTFWRLTLRVHVWLWSSITEDGATRWFFDDWRNKGDVELDKTFCWSNLFLQEWNEHWRSWPSCWETLAQKAKGVKAPGERTDLEVLEHNLTHLPFRSWCKICVQSKSKQNPSRTLKTRQPVLQMDYIRSYSPGEPQTTLLNVVDVLSGLALSVVVPQKRTIRLCPSGVETFCLGDRTDFRNLAVRSWTSFEAACPDGHRTGRWTFLENVASWLEASARLGRKHAGYFVRSKTNFDDGS